MDRGSRCVVRSSATAQSGLQHDVYLGIYFVVVLAGFTAYAVATGLDIRATLRRHWKLGVVLGVVFGFALVRNVLSEDGTPRPHGAYYGFELISGSDDYADTP